MSVSKELSLTLMQICCVRSKRISMRRIASEMKTRKQRSQPRNDPSSLSSELLHIEYVGIRGNPSVETRALL